MSNQIKTPWHLWLIALFFIFIYANGVYDYFMMLGHNIDYYESKGFGEETYKYFTNYPILDGTLDFAFIMDTMKSGEALSVEPLIQEDIKMVTSSDHPLLAKSEVFPKDLIAGNTFTYRNGMLLSNAIGRRFSCSRRISIK